MKEPGAFDSGLTVTSSAEMPGFVDGFVPQLAVQILYPLASEYCLMPSEPNCPEYGHNGLDQSV